MAGAGIEAIQRDENKTSRWEEGMQAGFITLAVVVGTLLLAAFSGLNSGQAFGIGGVAEVGLLLLNRLRIYLKDRTPEVQKTATVVEPLIVENLRNLN